jgi:hypothetical protein
MNLPDEWVNRFLHEASGNPDRIGEILRSLNDQEILVQRAASLPDDVRAALEAELNRREDEKRRTSTEKE